jgi:Flp pilus assembly protein TadG
MHRGEERGQAMVEFTLIASVLGVLLLTVFQFGVVFSNYINVADAARAAARKASTSGATSTYVAATEAAGRQYAIDSSNDASQHPCADGSDTCGCTTDNWCTTVNSTGAWIAGNPVVATVTAPYTIKIFGLSVTSGTLRHSVTMRIQSNGT